MGYGHTSKKKLTSDWSDTVAKWFKHLTVDQKVPGLNPTGCFTGKVFLYSSSPWETTSLCLKGLGGKNYTLLPSNCPCAYGKIYTMQLQLQTTNWLRTPSLQQIFIAGQFNFLSLETVTLTQERF